VAFAWPFIRGPKGAGRIADPGYSLTYTLLNPEQWLKNVATRLHRRERALPPWFQMKEHYFDDLKVGDRFKSDSLEVTEKQVIEFAHKFDPQMFHLTRKAAERTIFKGLIASGWHTAAMSMRLLVQTLNFAEGAIGLGVDELRWPNVVRPGDVLTLETEIVDRRPSRSKPKYGIIRLRNVTKNQRGEIVQTMLASAMLPRR
jgi:acyl dehydratase